MNFSLEQLRSFVAVYEQRSFSKAAVKLEKHRTTIGQVITNLEDQVAVQLFERIGRSVEPTTDGTLLYHYAKQAVEQAHTFDQVALSLSYGQLESINIAYCSFIPHSVLAHIRKNLQVQFPLMKVNFFVRTKEEVEDGIKDGTIHFAIVNSYKSIAIKSIDATFFRNVRFSIFVSRNDPLASLPSDLTFGALRSGRQLVLASLIEDDIAEKVILSAEYEVIDQLSLIIKFLQQGLGWSILPQVIKSSEYVSENLVEITCDEMREHFQIPIALWCKPSKQSQVIKKSIIDSIFDFLENTK
ncbi:LysR family transcriptional regulator [Shewanella aestuarii]|uniref:LysR family transcriptional regulator n=1 Tax=Shewanella aestuarii TaxID=1028752 RepID=A0A6G9QNF6_9GAMM|nr:LysR family transcriptional regulator [Shewanella aestuarii]QIR15595.1 LysR family transcriptional regulator [Shewanella aestuarii]